MDNNKDEENIGSFYMGRTRQPPEPKRVLPAGVLSVVALALLAGIVWYAYPRGAERYTDMDVPVVKADTAPIKEEPVDPGGMEVRHQDSTVFDPLEKKSGTEVERLLPTPEEPMDKEKVIEATDAKPALATKAPQLDLQMKDIGNGAEKVVAKTEAPATPAANDAANDNVTDADIDDALATDEPEDAPAAKTAAIAAPAAVTAAKTTAAAAPAATGDTYEVQLGSYRDIDGVKKDWERLKKKYASQLGGLTMRSVKVSLPGKGTFYRLQAGIIASKEKAQDVCSAIKAGKGVCILAKK